MKAEGIYLEFTEEAIEEICSISEELNNSTTDIGARRLITVIDKVIEEINFDAPEIYEMYKEQGKQLKIIINDIYVRNRCTELKSKKTDFKKYLL